MNFRPKPKKVAYVVLIGRMAGIYTSWDECRAQTEFFRGACFKGYERYEDAIVVWDAFEDRGQNLIKPPKKKRRLRFKCPANMPHQAPRPNPAIAARARHLVATHTGPDGSGSHTTTCTAATCTYPACKC